MSGRLLVRCAFAFRLLLVLILSGPILLKTASPAEAAGPLRTNPANPKYFVDNLGNAVYLAGSYQNPYNLLSGSVSEITAYFDFLAQQNQNFTRLWAWEQSPWAYDQNGNVTFTLQPYERTGPGAALDGGLKFDLSRFNQAYFDQLRSRIIAAGQRGIYVSLILFEGFSTQRKVRQVDPWLADPFHGDNNVNGINADENSDGRGTEFFSLNPSLTALQEAFVRKIVDTLEDLDNVLYEISGDTLPSSLGWQFHMLEYLKSYQATKLNRQPVGMSQFYGKSLTDVLSSSADWVVIQGSKAIPALATANKVLFLEGNAATSKQPAQWVWQSFMRGYNPINSEGDGGAVGSEIHAAIGQTKAYAALLDMASMTPSDTACSNRLCLVDSRSQYLTYLPSGGSVTLDLSNATGNLVVAWFDPTTGETTAETTTTGGQRVRFSSPARAQSILQVTGNRAILSKQERTAAPSTKTPLLASTSGTANEDTVYASRFALQDNAVATPTITPNGGIYSGSVKVTLQTSTPGAAIYYTTDGQTPTSSSQRYKSAFTLSNSTLVKAVAIKNNMNPSAPASAWFSNSSSSGSVFDYSLSISGDVAVTAGAAGATNLTATLNSGSAEPVSFAFAGLPSGATANLSALSCNPSCASTLNIATTASTPTGNFPITVAATGGGLQKTAAFALTVSAPSAVTAPVITPNGGSFTNSVSVTMATNTSGASIYYTTNGSSPTQASTPYNGPITVSSSTVFKAKAFKSGYNPSPEVSASFTKSTTNIGTPGLVAHWKFDEGTGYVAGDVSGNNNTGTLANGPTWVSGVAGHALLFDGTDDSVDVLSSLNLANIFTLSAWVNPATTFTDFRAILVKNYKYYLYSSVAGYCGNGSPLGGFAEITNNTVCQPGPLPINAWTHLALTSDGSKLTLYRNGATVATGSVSETLSPTAGSLQIGASQYGENFQGLIDEVSIYNRALSTTEIQAIYQQAAVNLPFDYSLSNSGDQSVIAGSSVTDTISTTLVSGVSQAVSFSVSGLPSGATRSFSSTSCSPFCSTLLTITTSGSTPTGNYPITVSATGGGVTRTTAFTLSVGTAVALVVATPTITPNGGNFSGSVSVSMQSATSGASIYYTTDGSTPTQSSTLYTAAMTLTSNATVKAAAFKSGYNPSAIASASFTNTINGTSSTASYYVGKNGSDSNSCAQARSSNTPKLTINAALACVGTSVGAGAGQIVEVAAGVYSESLDQVATNQPFPTGTSWGAPFTLRAKAGDQVTIKSNSGKAYYNMRLFSPKSANFYVIIEGFIFDATNVQGSFVVGSCCDAPNFVRFQNNELINNNGPDNAILISHYASNIEILHNKIHGGTFLVGPSGGGGGGDFSYPMYVGGNSHLIEGNELYDFPSFGIHIYNGYNASGNNNILVRKNSIHDFGLSGNTGVAILLSSGLSNTASNNLIYNGRGQGIRMWDGCRDCTAYNNTIFNVSGNEGIATFGSVNSIVKNNISFSNGTNLDLSGRGTVASNNLTSNPQFSNPAAGDFRLQSGSPAINQGADLSGPINCTDGSTCVDFAGTIRPQGPAWDIGAYEYR